MKPKTLLLSTLFTLSLAQTIAQSKTENVTIVGAMKNVMWKGQLYGTIALDTIKEKTHLYGLGPVEYLKGEVLIIDGKSYKSTVASPTEIKVEETYNIKAPFFGYKNISKWKEQALPDSIQNIKQLEKYLDVITKKSKRPFLFKLSGTISQATIHIVNLPTGTKVSSPDEAHTGQINYQLSEEPTEIVGFFSTEHKAIFTHHDTFLHMHLITSDRKKMGHLDDAVFKKGTVKLYLPVE